MSETVDIQVNGHVPALRQPTAMSRWATAATIMECWRRDQSLSIETVLEEINEGFLSIFESDTGLPNEDVPDFLAAMGLVAEPPMSFGVDRIAALLEAHGPIWVTADEDLSENFSVHARLVTGIVGDETPDGTLLTIIDPEKDSPIEESVHDLQEKFTHLAIGDLQFGGNLAQLIHFED